MIESGAVQSLSQPGITLGHFPQGKRSPHAGPLLNVRVVPGSSKDIRGQAVGRLQGERLTGNLCYPRLQCSLKALLTKGALWTLCFGIVPQVIAVFFGYLVVNRSPYPEGRLVKFIPEKSSFTEGCKERLKVTKVLDFYENEDAASLS